MARAFSRSCESHSSTTPSSSSYPPPPPAIPVPESSCQELEPSSSDSRRSNAKNLAWSTPSNGVADVEPFMGADSWPALSETARSSSDSSKALSELSASVYEENLIASNISTNPTNPNSNLNHALSDPEKPMAQGGSDASWTAATIPNSSPRSLSHNRNSGESGSKEPSTPQFHNRASHPRNSFRRGNGGGPRPRGGGGGAYHNGNVNRRDHSRPNNEGNRQRDFCSRGAHMQQQRFMSRNFQRPPPVVGPSQPIGPLGYPDMYSPHFWVFPPHPEALVGGMQYYAPAVPPMMYYPQQDPQLISMLVKQIDYYFSLENLCKDTYLRQNMDQHGWVPISLIAGFNRVKQLTTDVQSIITAVQNSTVVEVQGDKIRKRNDWMNWLLPLSNHSSIMSRPQSSGTLNSDMLAACMESVGLEGSTSDSSSRRALVETKVDHHLGNQSVNKIDP